MSTTDQRSTVVCPHCGRANRLRQSAPGAPHCGGCARPLPWLVDADQPTFRAAVEESQLPVLVDFWAPWCAPCRIVAPVLERLSREMAGRLKVVKVDADQAPEVAQRFDVRGIPTLIIFDRGRVLDRLTGAPSPPALQSWVETRLASRQPG
jgi:thioredoxin 2